MMLDDLREELSGLREAGLYRRLRRVEGSPEAVIRLDGREAVNFASNNYLGLADHPALKTAAIRATKRFGTGAGASRLITGTMAPHLELEKRIAAFEETDDAILFNSGYTANVGALTALLGRDDAVFGDRLNHASLVDGCRLSGAAFYRYRHADPGHLDHLLQRHGEARRRLVATDTIFSVDGDPAPLAELVRVCARRDAWLMVDEAHATGCIGDGGRGLLEQCGLQGRAPILMGTLSKAVGSVGGYVAGAAPLIDLLRNRARSFIYTTALPPGACAASQAGLDIIEREPARRARLWRNAERLRLALRRRGWDTGRSESQIIPVAVGKPEPALALSERLLEAGFFAPALRPPTVPPGSCRLRVSVMSEHTIKQIDAFVEALGEAR